MAGVFTNFRSALPSRATRRFFEIVRNGSPNEPTGPATHLVPYCDVAFGSTASVPIFVVAVIHERENRRNDLETIDRLVVTAVCPVRNRVRVFCARIVTPA